MTYLDDLLDAQNQPDVEYIPLVEETDDAIEPKLNDGDVLGVLPLRNMVLFPGVLLPVTVGRPKSKKLVATAFKNDQLLAVCCHLRPFGEGCRAGECLQGSDQECRGWRSGCHQAGGECYHGMSA